jgi:Ni,Fe-hydrogenase III large subunit/Ni,Fe-hydrogenase III component G
MSTQVPSAVSAEHVRQVLRELEEVSLVSSTEAVTTLAHTRVHVPPDHLIAFYRALHARLPCELCTMVALDLVERHQVRAVWRVDGSSYTLEVITGLNQTEMPSITPLIPSANWYEREIQDMFGIRVVGHPDPRRLALHRNWPQDIPPLSHNMAREKFPPYQPDEEDYRNRTSGEGLMEIPVGPIPAGIIEPGHFRFSAIGEIILNLEARLFYTHRGIEKQLEGMLPEPARFVVERTCAACTVASTLAYCQALENIAGQEIPPRAAYLRVIFAELERLYNHVGDTGNLCAGIGFHAGTQRGAALKERLRELNARVTGSRYLFGVFRPGGAGVDLDVAAVRAIQKTLAEVQVQYRRLVRMMLGNSGVVDRLQGTGVLSHRTALDLGAVGVAARASGVDRDVRRDKPYAAYGALGQIQVPIANGGDVLARLEVRVDEAKESFRIIADALNQLPSGSRWEPLGKLDAGAAGFGMTESARGAVCHWVQIGPERSLARVRLRTASFANWPAVPRAALNNIVPDFPLINKSFELCYSCLDR